MFQRQSRVLNRNLNSLAQPSQRQGLRHPPSDKPSSRRIDVTTPSSTPRTRARTTIERTDRRWNKRNAPPRHRPRRHRVVASSRFTRRFVHPSHQGSFTRPPHARSGRRHSDVAVDATIPRTHRSREKNKIHRHHPPSRPPSPSSRERERQITRTSVAAARTTVAAARTAVAVPRARPSASSRRPADVNVADRAVGRAHAAGTVAARRVVAVIVGVAVTAVIVIVVANMMYGTFDRVRVALPAAPSRSSRSVSRPSRSVSRSVSRSRRVEIRRHNTHENENTKKTNALRVPVKTTRVVTRRNTTQKRVPLSRCPTCPGGVRRKGTEKGKKNERGGLRRDGVFLLSRWFVFVIPSRFINYYNTYNIGSTRIKGTRAHGSACPSFVRFERARSRSLEELN